MSKGKINLPFLNTSLSLSSDIAPLSSSDTVGKNTLRSLSFGTKEENLFYLSSSDLTQENLSYLSSSDTGQRNFLPLSSSDLIRRSIESEDDILSNNLFQKTKHNINSNNLSKKTKHNISSNNLSQPKNITYTQTTYLNRKDTI